MRSGARTTHDGERRSCASSGRIAKNVHTVTSLFGAVISQSTSPPDTNEVFSWLGSFFVVKKANGFHALHRKSGPDRARAEIGPVHRPTIPFASRLPGLS